MSKADRRGQTATRLIPRKQGSLATKHEHNVKEELMKRTPSNWRRWWGSKKQSPKEEWKDKHRDVIEREKLLREHKEKLLQQAKAAGLIKSGRRDYSAFHLENLLAKHKLLRREDAGLAGEKAVMEVLGDD